MIALLGTELFKIIDRATEYGFNRAMEKCTKLSSHLTKQEYYTQTSRREIEKAIRDGRLKTVNKGKRVYVLRKSFDKWLLKSELLSPIEEDEG